MKTAQFAIFVVNTCILRQAGRICGEVSGVHSRSKRFASGRRCVRLLGVHRCKRFASGRRCVRLFCAYLPLPRRNGRSPGRSAAATVKAQHFSEPPGVLDNLQGLRSLFLCMNVHSARGATGPSLRRLSGPRFSSTNIDFSDATMRISRGQQVTPLSGAAHRVLVLRRDL